MLSSTANSGSTKRVSPDTERSCTTPGSCGAAPTRTGIDEAVVAQRDVGVGDDVGHAAARDEVLELAGQASRAAGGSLPRTRAKRVAGLVEHDAVVVEGALQRRLQVRKRHQALGQLVQRLGGGAVAAEVRADGADGLQRLTHGDQRLAVEREALVGGAAQMRPHVGKGVQRGIAVLLEQAKALPGALQRRIGGAAVGHRRQPAAAFLAGAGGGELGQARADARKFQCEQIAGSHGGLYCGSRTVGSGSFIARAYVAPASLPALAARRAAAHARRSPACASISEPLFKRCG